MRNNFQDLLKSKLKNLNSIHDVPENVNLDVIGNDYTKIRLSTSKDQQLGLKEWIQTNVDFINTLFEKDRILLFKGFASLAQKRDLSEIVAITSKGKTLNYTEPSTSRTKVNDEIYTSRDI